MDIEKVLEILGPTFLVILGGLITWLVQNRIDKFNKLKEDLYKERLKRYLEIIDPIIMTFSQRKGKKTNQISAAEKILSYEYRKTSFELNFYGNDSVIHAFNELMQYFYRREANENISDTTEDFLNYLGNLFLEIRKELGNKNTKLKSYDMLRSLITDIDKYGKHTI